MGFDSHFQKTPIITPEKRAVQPEDAFEDTAFKPGFEICQILNHVVESQALHFFVK
jgi:hypothetical protein